MKIHFSKISKGGWQLKSINSERMLFGPALFFGLLGLLVLIAPRFFLALIASFFLFVGIACALLAWKFIQLRKTVSHMMQGLNGKIVVQDIKVRRPASSKFEEFGFDDHGIEDIDFVEEREKKIILH